MTNLDTWQRDNDAFLSAALKWLRLRLTRLAEQGQGELPALSAPRAEAPGEADAKGAHRRMFGCLGRQRKRRREPERTPLLPGPSVTEAEIADAAQAMTAAEAIDPPPALAILTQRLGLSRFERDALLLCAAMEMDTRMGPLCARVQGDPARPHPTFALALALFEEPAWDALSPERPLRFWRLLEITQPGASPLTQSPLRADERIVNYIKGLNYLDDRLAALLTAAGGGEVELPASQRALAEDILRRLQPGADGLPVVQLLGSDGDTKEHIAGHVAAALGLSLYRASTAVLPNQWDELETLARLWHRESLLLPVALLLRVEDSEREQTALARFLGRSNGVVFLATGDPRPEAGTDVVTLEAGKPTWEEQQAVWRQALGTGSGDLAERLAGQFNLSLAQIWRISSGDAQAEAGPERADSLWAACLAASRPRLAALAQRIEPKATWEQLVVPRAECSLLEQIALQVRGRRRVYQEWGFSDRMNRGLGTSVLFAGDSGTGKTMAAEVIANELRLSLYRIDLSAVVSKYIGETEKNLRRVFDAAEDGGAILFFDEADALFGKRSEVKDSHDRYANIEINYLLQRMEAYRGLAVLATNRKGALDPAFLRRLRFIVNFPFPGKAERALIWTKVFPPQTPLQGLDFEWLARIPLAGGAIQNIALNAAFLAADAGSAVSMERVLTAARAELRKLEKPVNEADFRWSPPAGEAA
jgi:hypothetical protein